jgi:hypothetical protein
MCLVRQLQIKFQLFLFKERNEVIGNMDEILEKQKILVSDLKAMKLDKSPFKEEVEKQFDEILPLFQPDKEGKVSVQEAERIWMTARSGKWIKDYVENQSNLLSSSERETAEKWIILFSSNRQGLIKLVEEKGPYVCMDAVTLIRRKVKEDVLRTDYRDIFSKSDQIIDWVKGYKKRKPQDYFGMDILNHAKVVASLCDQYTGLG